MDFEQIWQIILNYVMTPGAIGTVITTVIITAVKLVGYAKSNTNKMLDTINEKLMSLSVNKDVRLSLEQISKKELKEIKKDMEKLMELKLDEVSDETKELLDLVKVLLGAISTFKSLSSEQVAAINAALGKTTPATIIELKPVEKPVKKGAVEELEDEEEEEKKVNPFI